MVPKDIVICDWHYDRALPTTEHSAVFGLPVLACPWPKADVALAQLDAIRRVRTHATEGLAFKMQGVPQTTWIGIAPFAHAYFNEPGATAGTSAIEAVACFRALFRELRSAQ